MLLTSLPSLDLDELKHAPVPVCMEIGVNCYSELATVMVILITSWVGLIPINVWKSPAVQSSLPSLNLTELKHAPFASCMEIGANYFWKFSVEVDLVLPTDLGVFRMMFGDIEQRSPSYLLKSIISIDRMVFLFEINLKLRIIDHSTLTMFLHHFLVSKLLDADVFEI